MKSMLSLALVGVLMLAGCSPVPEEEKLDLGFSARTITGASFDASDLAGRDTLIWFWTPWCALCARESSDIVDLAEAYPSVTFIGIAGYGTEREMIEFTERTGTANLLHLNDSSGELWARFEVPIQPSTLAIDDSGNYSLRIGPSTREELEQLLVTLVDD